MRTDQDGAYEGLFMTSLTSSFQGLGDLNPAQTAAMTFSGATELQLFSWPLMAPGPCQDLPLFCSGEMAMWAVCAHKETVRKEMEEASSGFDLWRKKWLGMPRFQFPSLWDAVYINELIFSWREKNHM